jgi:hypothetical protein
MLVKESEAQDGKEEKGRGRRRRGDDFIFFC